MPPDGAPAPESHPPGAWPQGFVSTLDDRDALLALAHLDGITPRRLHGLAWAEGSARRCLAAVRRGRAGTAGDRDRLASISIPAVRKVLQRIGARQVCPGDEAYPVRLLDLPDPPTCLFVSGGAPGADLAVAVVGARRCSAYGREIAEDIGRGLTAAEVTVVSGAALGIDAAAHRGALSWVEVPPAAGSVGPLPHREGLTTMAVLGSGIDVFHPPTNRKLIERIADVGAIVSEYPPAVPAVPWRFPARNRLVAGLSRAVVVVEGAPGSGSMITAEFALELGRDVFAVPGPVTNPLSAVPHQLIREGATLARGPDDVLEGLGLEVPEAPGAQAGPPAEGGSGGGATLPPPERKALEVVAGHPVTLDTVVTGSGLAVGEALSALVALELRGLIRVVAGRYERTAGGARVR